jgi:hypothetical protein
MACCRECEEHFRASWLGCFESVPRNVNVIYSRVRRVHAWVGWVPLHSKRRARKERAQELCSAAAPFAFTQWHSLPIIEEQRSSVFYSVERRASHGAAARRSRRGRGGRARASCRWARKREGESTHDADKDYNKTTTKRENHNQARARQPKGAWRRRLRRRSHQRSRAGGATSRPQRKGARGSSAKRSFCVGKGGGGARARARPSHALPGREAGQQRARLSGSWQEPVFEAAPRRVARRRRQRRAEGNYLLLPLEALQGQGACMGAIVLNCFSAASCG